MENYPGSGMQRGPREVYDLIYGAAAAPKAPADADQCTFPEWKEYNLWYYRGSGMHCSPQEFYGLMYGAVAAPETPLDADQHTFEE